MARISPSRHPLYCGLWVLGGRTEPFFPLCPRRQIGTTRMPTAPGIPSSGRGPCAWSGIIRGQSQAFDRSLHGFWYGNSRLALFVGLHFYVESRTGAVAVVSRWLLAELSRRRLSPV